MLESISGLTFIVFIGLAALVALGLAFYVGYITGKDKANTTTYSALNELITEWNKLIRHMPIMPPSPRLGNPGERT